MYQRPRAAGQNPSAVCGAVADPPFILHTMGWGLSSLLSLQDSSFHSSQAPGNNESLISSGSRGQKPNSLRSNHLLFAQLQILIFSSLQNTPAFQTKIQTGQDPGDTFTCTALPNLKELSPHWAVTHLSFHYCKNDCLGKKEFLDHQFFQESSFRFILQVTAAEHTKYQLSSWQFSKKNPKWIFPCWFINFKAQTEIFQMQHSLLLKNPFYLCPGWWGVSPVCKCTCAFSKLSACYKPKNLSWNTVSHKSKAESHSPFTSIQILSPTVENITGVKLYIPLGDLTKMEFKMKKILPWKKAWFMQWNRQVSRGHCCLEACSQDSWS